MRSILFILFSVFAGLAAGQLIGPVGPTTQLEDKDIECNILDYGGVADNETDVATSIETTFTECVLNNPKSRLVIPEGDYLIKRSVVLSNGTNWAFQLDGLITAAYGGNWTVDRELILQGFAGEQIINSTINGEGDGKFLLDVLVIVNAVDFEFYSSNGLGAFQGQGYIYRNLANTDRPRLVRLISPTNASVHDLILVDSPKFHIVFDFAVNLEAYHLTIRGANLGSYDGIDAIGTNYYIHDNEAIENLVCNQAGSGVSIGSLNVSAEISNIEARNISIIQGNNIAFIKTYPGGSGYVKDVTFENFRSLNSLYGLDINQYWQNTWEPDTGSVTLSNLVFKNFSGSVADGALRPPLYLFASDLTFATNVTVEEFSVWTETGTTVVNKISNIFGTGDDSYGENDGIESLQSGESPYTYTSTYTITASPTNWQAPSTPTWALPSTGYGTQMPITSSSSPITHPRALAPGSYFPIKPDYLVRAWVGCYILLTLSGIQIAPTMERNPSKAASSLDRDQVERSQDLKDGSYVNLAEPDDSPGSDAVLSSLFRRSKKHDPDAIATTRSVFDDPSLAPFYQPHPKYENLHRFDPSARWTYREETKVRRKTDWSILLWILVMFFGLNLDRGNLSNANSDNLLGDLNLTTNDYNNAQNMYRVGFLIAEIPSQMLGKAIGPDRWIPVQIILWSFASGGQFFMHNRAGFFACRFFIGLFMGGFIPDSILYLSYFYTKAEMPFRLALFWFTDSISGVIASFIAYGVLHMRGVDGREGWRWLFLIEALISFVIGCLSFLFLVPGPTQTRTWWNPKGIFSEREETIIVNRVLRDDPSKGDMHNRQALSLGMLWKSLKDYDLWPIYIIGIMFEIPTSPPKSYLTLSLKAIGFSTFQTTLLSIPVTVFAAINLVLVALLSEFWGQISIVCLLTQLWSLPLLIVLYTSAGSLSNWGLYAVSFILLGWPNPQAAQLSGIASSNIYRSDDKPLYRRGNRQLIAINVATIVMYALAKFYYVSRNRWKKAQWDKMTAQEKATYLETTTDEGNKRLDFYFDS
ncbi:CAZyme family GH28 [Aspergillus niger]|nr:CAZyme family GH28 [Aspergillus niger]KAI2975134.1 CAZyme family GH28 [Aspergillus niger]KAI3034724.1 CAZyme family GH28 [Aspergillus niger]KAI3073202.1 CAZyme family GH28 [Aspergillus niger]